MTTIYLFVLSILSTQYVFVCIYLLSKRCQGKLRMQCLFWQPFLLCYLHILTSSVRKYLVIRILPRIFYFTKYSRYLCNDFFLHNYTFWQQQQQTITKRRQYLVENMLEKRCVSRLTAAIWLLLFKSSSCFYFLYQLLQSCLVVSCLSFFSRDRHHATVYQKYYNLVQMYPKYNKYTEN